MINFLNCKSENSIVNIFCAIDEDDSEPEQPSEPESEGTLIIPTMGQWGMIISAIILGFAAVYFMRINIKV